VIVHQPGCPLDSVHWFRHAVAAAGCLAEDKPDDHVDRVSATSLTDTLAHFAELDDWATVTLRDIADHATLMNWELNQKRFRGMCTCGAHG
jgi:hypothetical protein